MEKNDLQRLVIFVVGLARRHENNGVWKKNMPKRTSCVDEFLWGLSCDPRHRCEASIVSIRQMTYRM
jgi:hypothetical protein